MLSGHYLPTLAKEIVDRNSENAVSSAAPVLNFKGFAVGKTNLSYLGCQ
jgi:hypothetical protein